MNEKSTQQLLELMKNKTNYGEYLSETQEDLGRGSMKLDKALQTLLSKKKLLKSEVIARSGIENHYAYQIFNGTKTPTRDKVLMLCIGFALSVEETQKLLLVTGYAQLYAKDERDNVILFSLTHKKSILDVNALLYELGLELLQ